MNWLIRRNKPYATLKQRFDMVTGESSGDDSTEEVTKPELAESKPATKATVTTKPKATTAAAKAPSDNSDDFSPI